MRSRSRDQAEALERALSDPAQVSADLRPLVETAKLIEDAFAAEPGIDADRRIRDEACAAFRRVPAARDELSGRRHRGSARRLVRRALIAAVLLVLIPSGALAAAWPAAQSSLPGQPLYVLKLGVERARIAFVSGEGELDVYLDIADARVDEAERAEEAGLTEAMEESLRRYSEAVLAYDATLAGLPEPAEAAESRAQAAFAHHLAVLSSLLDRVPDVAAPGLRMALELADSHGPPDYVPIPGGPPEGVPAGGLPETGEPEGAGGDSVTQPGEASPPEDLGRPEDVATGPPPSAAAPAL